MNRKTFQVRRTPPPKLSDLSQKPPVPNTRAKKQQIGSDLSAADSKNIDFPIEEETVFDGPRQTEKIEAVPRSAPLSQNKIMFKGDSKEPRGFYKKNTGTGMGDSSLEAKKTDSMKNSNNFRAAEVLDEKKHSAGTRRDKASVRRVPSSLKNKNIDKKSPIPNDFVMEGVTEESEEIKDQKQMNHEEANQQQSEKNTIENETDFSKNIHSTLSIDDISSIQTQQDVRRKEYLEKENFEQRNEEFINIKEDRDSFNNDSKPPTRLRGTFAREHIPMSELQKQNEQKRLMKEYLDSQLNEKKRKKEEEKQRELEFHRKEEERIKKEIAMMEQRHEKEIVFETRKNVKSEVPKTAAVMKTAEDETNNRLSRVVHKIPDNVGQNEQKDKLKTPEKEPVKTQGDEVKETPRDTKAGNSGQPVAVDKLVEENKQLRDENTKKEEIIDILINALRHQSDQSGASLHSEQLPQGITPLSIINPQNLPTNLKNNRNPDFEAIGETRNTKEIDNRGQKFFNFNSPISPPTDNLLIRSPYDPQHGARFYSGKMKYPPLGNIEPPTDLTDRLLAMNSPLDQNPYKMFMPPKIDFGLSQSQHKGGTSPRASQGSRINVYSSGVNIPGYVKPFSKTPVKSKQTFLPSLGEPSSAKGIPRTSPTLGVEGGSNRNSEHLKFFDGVSKRDELGIKDTISVTKHTSTDLSLPRFENIRRMNDAITNHLNFPDIFSPQNLSVYRPQMRPNINGNNLNGDNGYIATPLKTDYGIVVLDEKGNKVENQFKDKNSLALVRNVKSHGNLFGLGGISVVDMAENSPFNSRKVAERGPLNDGEGGKMYIRDSVGGVSERGVQGQYSSNKSKFPKEIFNVNLKKKMNG